MNRGAINNENSDLGPAYHSFTAPRLKKALKRLPLYICPLIPLANEFVFLSTILALAQAAPMQPDPCHPEISLPA